MQISWFAQTVGRLRFRLLLRDGDHLPWIPVYSRILQISEEPPRAFCRTPRGTRSDVQGDVSWASSVPMLWRYMLLFLAICLWLSSHPFCDLARCSDLCDASPRDASPLFLSSAFSALSARCTSLSHSQLCRLEAMPLSQPALRYHSASSLNWPASATHPSTTRYGRVYTRVRSASFSSS